MTIKVQDKILNTFRAKKTKASSSPISVQKVEELNEDTAAVLLHSGQRIKDEAELAGMVSKTFNNKVRMLPGSAFMAHQTDSSLIQAYVVLNRESMPVSEVASAGHKIKAVSPNVFRDEEDAIWEKIGEGEEAMLVKKGEDDLMEVLGSRRSMSMVTAAVASELIETTRPGDAIVWYDFKNETRRAGVRLTAELACDFDSKNIVAVTDHQIMAAMNSSGPVVTQEISAFADKIFAPGSKRMTREEYVAKYVAFAKLLFGKHPEYFDRLKALLASQFGKRALSSD